MDMSGTDMGVVPSESVTGMKQPSSEHSRPTRRRVRRVPLITQLEMAECGLACIAMILAYHGQPCKLSDLRARLKGSSRGVSLSALVRLADSVGLAARGLRVEAEDLGSLSLPCVLHWDLDHFVVLAAVKGDRFEVLDPIGHRRWLSSQDLNKHFTGVALELLPVSGLRQTREVGELRFRDLVGGFEGLGVAIATIVGLTTLVQIALMTLPLFSRAIIDKPIGLQLTALLPVVAIAWAIALCIHGALDYTRNRVSFKANQRYALLARAKLFDHALRLPMQFFERRSIGDVHQRFRALDEVLHVITDGTAASILDGVFCVVAMICLVLLDVRLAGVAIVSLLVLAIVVIRSVPAQVELLDRFSSASIRESNLVLESIRAAQTVKLLAAEARRLGEYTFSAAETVQAQLAWYNATQRTNLSVSLIIGTCEIGAMSVGAYLVIREQLSLGSLVGLIAYLHLVLSRFQMGLSSYSRIRHAKVSLRRVADIWCEPEEGQGSRSPHDVEGCIELQDVAFRYSHSDPLVVSGIGLSIDRGECIAIVGPSGTGKTTLIKILAGLLQPSSGIVRVDGKDIGDIDLSSYRSQIACVTQNDELLAGTVLSNVTYPDLNPDLERAYAALELACIADEIRGLPLGILTPVGDMGMTFSAGQRQRLILARAFYRKPKILFLDEPTSNIDLATERRLVDVIGSMTCTRIVVTHRPEILRIAERVGSLVGGQIHWVRES